MGLTVADKYYLKAKDASKGYYGDWEEACESLGYALSYEEHHPAALCLLGKIYAERFSNYEFAFECFDKVIANHPEYLEVYYSYAKYLIWGEEIERAFKLINHAFTLKGICRAELYWLSAYGLEVNGNYNLALKMLANAQLENYSDSFSGFLKDEKKRIKGKKRLLKKLQDIS